MFAQLQRQKAFVLPFLPTSANTLPPLRTVAAKSVRRLARIDSSMRFDVGQQAARSSNRLPSRNDHLLVHRRILAWIEKVASEISVAKLRVQRHVDMTGPDVTETE